MDNVMNFKIKRVHLINLIMYLHNDYKFKLHINCFSYYFLKVEFYLNKILISN